MLDRLKQPLGNEAGEVTPLEWVDLVVSKGVELKASDIHFDVGPATFITRLRIDGVLRILDERPIEHYEMVVARLKIMSLLNSAEHRTPQEGHAVVRLTGSTSDGSVDLRVSIFPTIFGEATAIRILNRREFLFESFEEMGMASEDAKKFEDTIHRPHGMILVTGPTGSGKSATLYTALNKIRSPEKNIVTLEDPVEYQLGDVRQSQINPDIGYTFPKGMRSILRQDPDVIMIGEIRDNETAEVAVRAALTGRLLFSTMHTNNSLGAVIRFLEFGIPRSFVATAMALVVAKRLIRQNCKSCIQQYAPSEKALKDSGVPGGNAVEFYRGEGCDACEGNGFSGRTGVYEFFYLDTDIEMAILDGASTANLKELVHSKGMRTLRQNAIRLALEGKTTLEEAMHTTV